jgi:uncharacterized protein DUF4386
MSLTRNPGRVAGFWYLLLIVIGPVRLIYIPNKLFVRENATTTVNNIAAHQWLFRFGMVSELVSAVLLIFLVLAFHRLFSELPAHVRDSRAGFLVGSVCGGSSSDDAGSSGGSK